MPLLTLEGLTRRAHQTPESIEEAYKRGEVGQAADMVPTIVFLCSDLARHLTGEVLNVNGGSVLCG